MLNDEAIAGKSGPSKEIIDPLIFSPLGRFL
jgi:hypothetical protein